MNLRLFSLIRRLAFISDLVQLVSASLQMPAQKAQLCAALLTSVSLFGIGVASGADTLSPANTTAMNFINGGAISTNNPIVTLTISATDAVGVVAYFPAESSQIPTAGTPGWVPVTPATS